MCEWKEALSELNPDAQYPDGLEEAFIGWIDFRWHKDYTGPVACYSRTKCIEILMRDGMSHEEAEDFFCFNTEGAFVGANTPLYLEEWDDPVASRRLRRSSHLPRASGAKGKRKRRANKAPRRHGQL